MIITIYLITSLVYAFIIMSNLENLRHTPVKSDLKFRNKTNKKIKDLEKDLNFCLLWPWLFFKKAKSEYIHRKEKNNIQT